MESEEFGPLTSAEIPDTGSPDELELLRQRVAILEKEKSSVEDDFGQKRAKFMELFRQKEDDLLKARNEVQAEREKAQESEEKMERLNTEVEGIKTAAALSEAARQDEIEEMQRRCQQEVASLQHIMKDAFEQHSQQQSPQTHHHPHLESPRSETPDRPTWGKAQEKLESELAEMRQKLSLDREGFLANMANKFGKRVTSTSAHAQSAESLEEDMKKAQEDAEILKSVVLPLEEEIRMLKNKLKDANDRTEQLTKKFRLALGEKVANVEDQIAELSEAELDEKVKELNHHLETEKASRTDLEMYVSVLNTQKTVLQEDADKLTEQLKEVCQLLEFEKREHNELKRTWTMANDQFLEAQRLMMMDMRRMESVLTTEQQRQIAELKKKDADREATEKKGQELEEKRQEQSQRQAQRLGGELNDDSRNLDKASSKTSLTSLTFDELIKFDDTGSPERSMPRSQSGSLLSSGAYDASDNSHETRSLHEEGAIRASPDKFGTPLTEEMQRAITDPTPESEVNQTMLAHAKAKQETFSLVGKRIVSEKEWHALQNEIKIAREKLGRPCDMCSNYEDQLQSVQDISRKADGQVRTLERQLQGERQAMTNTQKYTEELEETLRTAAEEAQKQVSQLMTKVIESEKYIIEMKAQFSQIQSEMSEQLKSLTEGREKVHKELKSLQKENDELVGKHSIHSQQMQEESIDLPNTLEELQLLALKYREEIITGKVAKEHIESTLRSEIMFLKDQVVAEQQEKANLEETLSQEISNLHEQLAILQSMKSEFERMTALRQESDNKLKESESSLKNIQAKSKQLINALQNQLEEQTNARTRLENEVVQLKGKVTSLQVDLDNSEAVQRDFVKLSQSLQIQLEKIRASENEVRWQHEEDIDDCSNCKQNFSVTKRKHHCRHCGRIFCADCLTKSVNSGPNLRPSKVCDVCHTILVQDATPYFSSEPPTTPD